ncbi:MAG: Ppx/GppA family phosphatase [Planctomycetes bacterium]|nr:Ppx/GppA family phosphatase [Planctomycetota bacterium]
MVDKEPERIAAVDLGSNSFHMVIARLVNGEPVVVDRIREPVRLAGGLDEDGRLDAESRSRALICLKMFAQRIRETPNIRVRAVGTNTLRRAKSPGDFLELAEDCLGVPIEIISGAEEARMIHLGVAHSTALEGSSQLVVDIGGGSTECILGRRFDPVEVHSLYMGCVSWSQQFFGKDGKADKKSFKAAVLAAQSELVTIENQFKQLGFDEAIGASGTIRAVEAVLAGLEGAGSGIDAAGVKTLGKMLVEMGDPRGFESFGLKADRAPVFAGGLAILTALFKSLAIERMVVSSGALREGIIYDMMGRLRDEDVRERSIRTFEDRFHVDRRQASRVERSARRLLEACAGPWRLDGAEPLRLLGWAARLHEIGLAVSWTHHNRHGAYLIQNATMPGFSRDDQQLLAAVVENQRRKPRPDSFVVLPNRLRPMARKLAVLLRVAVLLHRSRSDVAARKLRARAADGGLVLEFPAGFKERHPLTWEDLRRDRNEIGALGIDFELQS